MTELQVRDLANQVDEIRSFIEAGKAPEKSRDSFDESELGTVPIATAGHVLPLSLQPAVTAVPEVSPRPTCPHPQPPP